ncbi:serine/threonine protein kinase [Archangium gephyra]|uniref:Serine/threonine protein kinase n=1 Tax=Archangium gephyra TaxID=48 RepID=A0AAC8QFB5_9BACT|nr:serine/threonine protein kinase [Archangium gephyra]
MLSDPLIGAQLGEYVVRERIGEGGMGIVYRGEQPLIGKQVAVKVLRAEVGEKSLHVERLLAEARAVNAIRHRGIIDIFSFGQTPDGRQYFVMEYLQGSALDAHLAQHGLLPLSEVLRISEELLDALAAAHEAGVIHRDLKPNNLFLVRQPGGGSYVKVLDFGLAKQTSSSHGHTPQTQQGIVMGTPEYMAPEQACALPVTPKTDLYSFGVMLFQMLTGQLPFAARSSMEMLVQHVSQPAASPLGLRPELPPELAALVLKLLAKAPEERPSMVEVRAELQRLARLLKEADEPTRVVRGAKRPPAPQPLPAPPSAPEANHATAKTVISQTAIPVARRSRAPLIAVGGGFLLTLGMGLLFFPRPESPPVAPPVIEVRVPAVAEPAPAAPPSEPRVAPESPPPAGAVASAAEPEPAAEPAPLSPAPLPPPVPSSVPAPGTRPSSNTAQVSGSTRGRTERNPLLARIDFLEKRLRSAGLPEDERKQALALLEKAREKAEKADSREERKRLSIQLDRWKGQFLPRH